MNKTKAERLCNSTTNIPCKSPKQPHKSEEQKTLAKVLNQVVDSAYSL